MNHTEATLAILNYQPSDHLPVVHFGWWKETLEKWVQEGHLASDADGSFNRNLAWKEASEKQGFDYGWGDSNIGNSTDLFPRFDPTVVAEFPDGSQHVRNGDGVTVLRTGDVSIPAEIEHLLVDRASWEEHYKPRLQWSPDRLPKELPTTARDIPTTLHCGSIIGRPRDIIGVVGLAYMSMDDEELLDEIIVTMADLCVRNVEALCAAGAKFDIGHFWEDICFKNGPLVTPDFFREKVAPHYKRITDILKRHGVGLASLDCDGCIDELVPMWLENGVNTMFPIEVGTWNASIKPWREKYGREIRGVGGMNKNVFSQDKAAVDAEIERLKPLVALGGFIPCPDHRIPPDAKWDMVRYYCDQMHATRWG